jgi:hypothetical protein
MAKQINARGKRAEVSAELLIKALRESGIMNLDTPVGDLLKRVAEIERVTGAPDCIVVWHGSKYIFVMQE